MKSSMKRSGFGFQTWKFQKHPQKLHFRVTKKDTSFHFHFHVLNLFRSWSQPRIWPKCSNGHKNSKKIKIMKNLGFDQDSNGHKILKRNQKNEKPKHMVFLCHIVSIQVDKPRSRHIQTRKIMYLPLTLSSVLWSQAWTEVVLGFKHGKFKNHPKASF
jgi:hypothetical protein